MIVVVISIEHVTVTLVAVIVPVYCLGDGDIGGCCCDDAHDCCNDSCAEMLIVMIIVDTVVKWFSWYFVDYDDYTFGVVVRMLVCRGGGIQVVVMTA